MRSRILLTLSLTVFFVVPLAAQAAIPFWGPIIPPESVTGVPGSNVCAAGWGMVMLVINNIISFLITIAIVFVAPLMIAYAGFLFVVNPVNAGGIEKAKSILTHTVVGIVIALAGWLIVDAIMAVLYNRGAAGFEQTWQSLVTWSGKECIPIPGSLSQVTPTGPPPGVEVPPVISTDEQSVRDLLAKYNITINKPPCTAEQMTGPLCGTNPGPSCTNVAGMKPATVQQIINIANTCGDRPGANLCGVQVTGGTEPGHACGINNPYSHQNGYKVDLWQTTALNAYLEKFGLTGRRGGHYNGDIREDECRNEYVKESQKPIWDITIKTVCGPIKASPPGPETGERRTDWPSNIPVLQYFGNTLRVENVNPGQEYYFAYTLDEHTLSSLYQSQFSAKAVEIPGTPSGTNTITVYGPDNTMVSQSTCGTVFCTTTIKNSKSGLYHIIVVQDFLPGSNNPGKGAFAVQVNN